MKKRRIFISMPADHWLTDSENATKWAIVAQVEALGYVSEVFFDPRGTDSISAPLSWSAVACENVMRQCDGCVLLGFPRWRLAQDGQPFALPTDYNHYEGALAHSLGLPLLVLVQQGVERRVVFDSNYKGYVGTIPAEPSPQWLGTQGFEVPFKYWKAQLAARRDALAFSEHRYADLRATHEVAALELRAAELEAVAASSEAVRLPGSATV